MVKSVGLGLAGWLRNRASFFLHYESRQGIIVPLFTRLFDTKGLHPEFHTSIFRLSAAGNVYRLDHKPHASLLFTRITAAIIVINKVQALFLAFSIRFCPTISHFRDGIIEISLPCAVAIYVLRPVKIAHRSLDPIVNLIQLAIRCCRDSP